MGDYLFFKTSLELLSQFTGGRGGIDYNIVQFVMAAAMWFCLVVLATLRRRHSNRPHEELMIIGFSFALLREVIMLFMALLQVFDLFPHIYLHAIFPPLEHAISDISIIVVSASFMRYLLHDWRLSKKFLQVGIFSIGICYLLTFWWWGSALFANPQLTFGRTWCDWLFRVTTSLLAVYPILVLLQLTPKGWARNSVCLGLSFFFLDQFLKLPDMMLSEVYEYIFAPIRHGLYLAGIPLIGYVYVRELYEDHLQTEQKLLTSEQRYRSLFEDSMDALYVSSNDGHFIDINRAGLEMFGLSPEEVHSTLVTDMYVNPADRQHFQQEIQLTGEVHGYEVLLRKKDGRQMSCVLSSALRFDHKENIVGYQGVIRDVTLNKKIEGQLRQSEKMEAMGTLAGGIAHDFNNILTAIIGYTFIAKRALPPDGPAEKALDEIHSAGNRAKELVRQILTFSRRDDQVKKPLHLQVIIKEALNLLRATIPTSIEIRKSIEEPLPPVIAEPTQILQVLINLCTNAVHAMKDKGTLQISIAVCQVGRDHPDFPAVLEEGKYVLGACPRIATLLQSRRNWPIFSLIFV